MWRLSITNGLQAHFRQSNGSSRPGTDWVVVLSDGSRERRALVRTYTDRSPRSTVEHHAAAAVAYVSQMLENGWCPNRDSEPSEFVVPDDFVAPSTQSSGKRPWWKIW